MLGFLWRILPADYKWSVAIKKAGQMVGKAAAGAIVASAVGKHLPPQAPQAIEVVSGLLTTAVLEALHDWAKMKWPDAKWL